MYGSVRGVSCAKSVYVLSKNIHAGYLREIFSLYCAVRNQGSFKELRVPFLFGES